MIVLGYLALGAIAGFLGGLLGLGGGIIIVPALYFMFLAQGFEPRLLMHLAVATSLASVVATAAASTRAHQRRGAVLWPVFRALTPGIIAGALAGAALADVLPTRTLRIAFGIFEIFIAVQMLVRVDKSVERPLPGALALSAAGLVIGALSAVLGVGGGIFMVLYLLLVGVSIHRAVGTSAACGLPIALAATLGHAVAGWAEPGLPAWSLGHVYLPAAIAIAGVSVLTAPRGAAAAHALPMHVLRRIFAAVLALVGVRMLF